MSFFEKLKKGLQKTKNALFKPFSDLFKSLRRVDEDLMEELEEILICADVGATTTEIILEKLREQIKEKKIKDSNEVKEELKAIMLEMLGQGGEINYSNDDMTVILIIGVNGVGKTTSIGKISYSLKKSRKTSSTISTLFADIDITSFCCLSYLPVILNYSLVK